MTTIEKMRKHNRQRRLVRPEEVRVGDRVLIEVEVVRVEPVIPGGGNNHIHARVPRDAVHPWNLGDQVVWTWGWSGANGKKIEVIR